MYDRNSPFTAKPSALEPRQKTEFAEDRLMQAILWCELAPGSTATEVELAERFGLGRAATRAALAKLSAFGLMHPIPRLGWRVLPMSGALIGQVISARRLAEPALGEVKLSEASLDAATSLAQMISIIGDRVEDGSLLTRRGYERDVMEILLSGVNPIIASFLSSLWAQSDRIIRFLELGGAAPFGAMDADALIAAYRDGDSDAIRAIRLGEIEKFQSFVSLALLNDGSELTMDRGDFKPGAPNQKQEQTAPSEEPIRVSSGGRLSNKGIET
jgi:DNA-binding GntR family transcriptional regulator